MELRDVDPALDPGTARVLLQVQHAAYAIEAALIGDDRIPALHEDLAALQAQPLCWRVAFLDGILAGAVAWTEEPDGPDIDRLVVHPDAHRRGVGSALVRDILVRAAGRCTTVSTGRDNTPARRLYERLRFTHAEDVEVMAGLWVSRYVHGCATR